MEMASAAICRRATLMLSTICDRIDEVGRPGLPLRLAGCRALGAPRLGAMPITGGEEKPHPGALAPLFPAPGRQ
jgi:hypothetical protein